MEEDREANVALLQRVPLFSVLSREDLEQISRVAVARNYSRGVRVFHEGDRSDACYIVRSGDLRVTREHPDGRAIALATLGPGDIFGELAMLDGEARSASVEALSPCELLALPAGDVRRMLQSSSRSPSSSLWRSPGACAKPTSGSRGSPSRPSRAGSRAFSQLIAEETPLESRDGSRSG